MDGVKQYRRTPENSVDSFSSSEEDEPVQQHQIDEHSAAAPSLVFSSIYGPRPNSINRLQLANVDLPVSPESLPHTPPRTSRPTSHHSAHNHISITSPAPSRPLSSSLGIGIGGRAQGGLAEVFAAIANTQAQAQSTALPPSSAGSLPSPLSLSPKSPARSPNSPTNGVQEIIIKDEGYSLEQLPFKLALSNQSSLLLNRTSRAAQRRSSSFPQRQDTSSSSGVDREKYPTDFSAPERLSIGSLPKHPGDRPISVLSAERVAEEEQADDEQDEEEQEIVDESPSFEALQPYPRDVSTEPSPDPTRQAFIPPAPVPPPLPAQQPPKPHGRNNSTRHIDHELVIDELEERLGVEPTRRRRARSNAAPNTGPSATSPNRSTSQPMGKQADATWERKPPIQMPKSNVDMGAARDMLSAMFAKRDQRAEERIEEPSSDEQSFLPVDWDIGSMVGLDEEDQSGNQEVPAQIEPTVVQREPTSTRRKSIIPQSRASIPIPQPNPPIPLSQPAPQPDAQPQTPSTVSTVPETPNTQITHSTQPTPPSDHGFDETDTEDEHPEDLADLIEAEPVVLRTPQSVVLRREVGRETSLPSRTGTGTGAGTPGVWTPRNGSGAWTPRHGSVVGGSGGLQIVESPTVERRQPERRQSAEQSRPTLSQRRQPTNGQQIGDTTQSTISEVSLNTVSGQTENMSPVSRPLVSDHASVPVPIVAPAVSSAPILGSVPPLGNGLGLGLGLELELELDSVPPSGLGSSNDFDSGVLARDIVSPLPSVSTPSSPSPPSDGVLGLGAGLHSGDVSPAPSGTSPALVGSGPILPVAAERMPQAAPATLVSLSPVASPAEPPVASASVLPAESSMSISQAIVPAIERSITPESAPSFVPDPVPRAEPGLPVSTAESVVLQETSGSVLSVESGPSSSTPESNLVGRANPSLVAGPDSEDDLSISHSLDRDIASIIAHSSESSGVPVEPIRDAPHTDRVNLDSERVVPGSSRVTVQHHVPEQGGPFEGKRRGSKLAEDVHGNMVQDGDQKDVIRGDSMVVLKEMDEIVAEGEDRVEAAGVGLINEEGAASIEESHEDLQRAVHQGRTEERPRVTNIGVQDAAGGNKEDDRRVYRDVRQESPGSVNADIGKVDTEPVVRGGDVGARVLVSDSELEPQRVTIPISTSPPPSKPVSVLPDDETAPRVPQIPVSKRSTERVAENAPTADKFVVAPARVPSAKQASSSEANQDEAREQVGILEDATSVAVEPSEPIKAPGSVEQRTATGQAVLELDSVDANLPLDTQELATGALSKDDSSVAERLASEDGLKEPVASETSTTRSPLVVSKPPSLLAAPELAPITSLSDSISFTRVPVGDEAVLEPDHVDSLSELEESFGASSPAIDERLPKSASAQPVTPLLTPDILAPADALVQSTLPVLEESPMLRPISPLAPLSPTLHSSASISPSPPEPLSPISSPPTTSSLPGSPSLAVSFAPPASPSAPEPRLSRPQSILSSTNALPEDGSTIKHEVPVLPEAASRPTSLEPEQPMSPEPFSKLGSLQAESLTMQKASTSFHPVLSDPPLPAEHHPPPEISLSPRSPTIELQPSREPSSLEQVKDDAPGPGIIPVSKSSLVLEPVSPDETPSATRPRSSKSVSYESSPLYESAVLSQPSPPYDPSPSSEPLKTSEISPSPVTPKGNFPSARQHASLPQSPLAPESISTPLTPPLAEPAHPHDYPPLPTSSSSSLPGLGSSFAEASAPIPGPSHPNTPFEPLDNPRPLSEPNSGSVLPIPPEQPPSHAIVPPETPESTALPESSELSESISVPNSSLLPNNCLSDVSLPLEPLSSPRLSPLSPPRLSPLSQPPPSLESAELPGPSPSHNPSTLHEPSPLITHPLFEPSPWPGLSVIPKPSPSLPVSPSSLPHSSFHDPLPLSDPSHSPEPSPSPNPGPLPDVFSVPDPSMPPELPPTEYLQRNEQPVVPESSEAECLGNSQEPPVTPDRLAIRGVPDPLSPWGSLRLRRAPGLQSASDEEQQPPKSSLLFDCASLPPDSPQSSHTPLPRLPTLPEDSPLLDYAPSLEQVRSEEHTENFEGKGLPGCIEPLGAPVGTFAVSSERSGEPRSRSPIEEPQLSQRSSLSEIPSLSDFAPLPIRSDTAPQYVRTTSLASEPRAASEPYSKPRPRSQLKPLRLSLLHGLGTPSPGAIITPVSANTVTPSPSFGSEVATPTPAAMYPTPSSAHPTQMSANLRSSPKTQATVEEITEANVSAGETTGLDPVSWFGAKNGVKRGTLSAARQSVHRSVQESNRSSLLHDATILSEERGSLPATTEQPSPHSPIVSAEYKDEDVRPLPMIWDDETEAGSIAGPSRQGTRSSIQSQSRAVPALETSSPDTGPVDVAPPPKTPDRLDTVPRYPTFVTIGTTSPRISEGKSPLPSPPAVSERASESPGVQRSDVEPAAPRSRKWADTINQESIGSLPDFSVPTPSAQMLDEQPPESNEPHTPSNRKDRRHYMKIPNTAPLSISPRRVSPSIMQRDQEEGMGSYEQGASSQDEMQPYAAPDTAPLDLRLRMAKKESTTGPWMAEYFTNSPSSFHSSQVGGMHSASSSLSTRAKIVGNRYSVSSNKQVNGPLHVEDGTFGNPGPGPSTMKTYSERHQFAEVLGSPIALESQPPEPASSVPKTPRPYALTGPAKRMSSQISSASMDLTPTKAEDALQLKVSPAEPIMETEMSTLFSNTSSISQPPAQDHSIEASPTEQRTTYKALSLSSPSPGRQPPTPLTAASPLQILRRNLMARTSPESPRFLSPQTRFTNLPEPRLPRHHHHASVSLAPTTYMRDELRNVPMSAPGPRDRRSLTPNTRFAATPSIPGSPAQSVHSTISQSKPLLFFAIAKNSAQEVERLLQDGEVKPNDKAGPEDLPALAFALANEQLSDKTQIVKSLLSHGADPSSVLHRKTGSGQFDDADLALTTRIEQGMNPAIRYYLNRKQMTIPAPQAELLEKHNFGGLTRAGFSIIGQDAALEELIRVVAGHCRRQALNPLVVVFSGGPGCGKSLLASKIGPLLHVPYFTVNMTNLRNEATLFNYISMTTKVGQPQIPLMDFLRNNQGRRCVVVLEEIEKAADKTVWHSLLMPWEWGKATVISPTNNEQIDIDTSQVIWIATSNSGDDATLKFFAERSRPTERGESALVRLAHNPRPKEDNFTRKDYLQLMQAVRKRLGELLGSSMISRVSSVLPFLPFTEDEVYALASESLSAMRAEQKGDQSYEDVDWEELLQQAVGEYIPGEGARSVHRAVQRAFDEIAEW